MRRQLHKILLERSVSERLSPDLFQNEFPVEACLRIIQVELKWPNDWFIETDRMSSIFETQAEGFDVIAAQLRINKLIQRNISFDDWQRLMELSIYEAFMRLSSGKAKEQIQSGQES